MYCRVPSSSDPRHDDTWQVASHVPTQRLFYHISGDRNGRRHGIFPLVAKIFFGFDGGLVVYFQARDEINGKLSVLTERKCQAVFSNKICQDLSTFRQNSPRFAKTDSPRFAKAVAPTGVSGVDWGGRVICHLR
jgi:hypothetical protein